MITDVIIPAIALVLSIILLVKFNWVGQFSVKDATGVASINIKAVVSMVLGYAVLPAIMYLYVKTQKN